MEKQEHPKRPRRSRRIGSRQRSKIRVANRIAKSDPEYVEQNGTRKLSTKVLLDV